MKRIRLFLVLSLLSMAMTTFAQTTWTDDDDRTFQVTNINPNYAKLTGYSGRYLIVPKTVTHNGITYIVTGMSTFTGNTKIESITFESGLQTGAGSMTAGWEIPSKAFQNCTALNVIDFGNNQMEIGAYAFQKCTALQLIQNPYGIRKINEYAFDGCKILTNFYDGTYKTDLFYVGAYAFRDCEKMEYFSIPFRAGTTNTSYLGEGAFQHSGLKLLYIPHDLSYIPKNLCYNCNNLEWVGFILYDDGDDEDPSDDKTIDIKLAQIGENAFGSCKSLNHLMTARIYQTPGWSHIAYSKHNVDSTLCYLKHLTTIGKSAFQNCPNFYSYRDLVFPSTLTAIGESAFAYCTNMGSPIFTGATNLQTIGNSCFRGCKNYWGIDLTKTKITSIPYYAFEGCTSLWLTNTSDTHGSDTGNLNGKIISIGEAAFQGCTNMDNLILDKTVTSIGNNAFFGCSDLTTVTIPSGNTLATIGSSAFYNCQKLKTFNFPGGSVLTSIGSSAFEKCYGITSNFQYLSNTKLKTVGARAFTDCINMTRISFPETIEDIDKANPTTCGTVFANDTSLVSITVPTSNTNYKASQGHPLLTADGKVLICYPAKHTTGYSPMSADYVDDYLVPAGVETISAYAFQNCQNEHFVLPKTVKWLGSYSFENCRNMTELTIPQNVTNIATYVFQGCSSLQSLYFVPTTVPAHGGSYSFSGLSSKTTAYVKTTYLSNYSQSLGSYFKTVTNIVPYSTSATKTYQTRCFDFDADFSAAVNSGAVIIWAITGFNSSTGKVTWAKTDGYIQARKDNNNNQASYNGVLIQCVKGTSGITFQIGDNSSPIGISKNYLVGCPGAHRVYGTRGYVSAPTRLYGLQDGKFKLYDRAGRIPYNRAYLDGAAAGIPEDYHAEIEWVFFDEDGSDVTAIEKLEAGVTETKENGAYYNLNGVKVENPTKGVYIHNGKKVVIK